MKLIFYSLLLMTSHCINAQSKIDILKYKPVKLDATRFCNYVGSKLPSQNKSGFYEYSYQEEMYESACIDLEKMSEKEVNLRLKVWWDLNKDHLKCDSTQLVFRMDLF